MRFSIVKFRTMRHPGPSGENSITTIDNERITAVGRFFRYWKLDELPQLLNVLRGEMSLVGPRPRVPDQQRGTIQSRPGITGAASLAFAREEAFLATIPRHHLDNYYANRVLPLKQRLDDAYMARATFASDLKLLFLTAFRVWIATEEAEPVDALSSDGFGEVRAVSPGESGD
jgi:lipopolysaccharide/colanic/teichoic acid biosynthesis glycosyltransferase